MKSRNNSARRADIDWAEAQRLYNSGMSIGDLCKKYSISGGALQSAKKRGEIQFRTRSDAKKLADARGKGSYDTWSEESKQSHRSCISEVAYARHAAGWDNKAGKCKKYHYTSPIAGGVTLDGTWELSIAQWLDSQGAVWRRNKVRFKYIHPSGVFRHYTPDFWAEGFGYIEVKGYETTLDRCKWAQFPEPLLVWREKEVYASRKELHS